MIDVNKIKKHILDLAIRGKLTTQFPEESALSLIESIKTKKEECINKGLLRKEKKLLPIKEADIPFKIPDNWAWIRLGDYSQKVTDQVASGSFQDLRDNVVSLKEPSYALMVKTADFANGFTKNLTYTDKRGYEFLSNSNLFGGELILSNIGSIGKVFIVPKLDIKMTLAPNSVMIRLFDEPSIMYLYYYLLSNQGFKELDDISTGSTMKKVNKGDLKTILLAIPPLEEQQRIVSRLTEIFSELDKIDENQNKLIDLQSKLEKKVLDLAVKGALVKQIVEEENASELYIATRNKIKDSINKKEYKSSDFILDENIQNEPFKIPSTWKWTKLGSICLVVRGGSPRPIKSFLTNDPNGLNWIKIGDTEKGGKYILSTKEKIKPSGLSKTRLVHKGDFLLTNSMSFGRPYILKIDGCIHDGWLAISPINNCFYQDYLYYLLSSNYAFEQFSGKASGSTVSNLNIDKVRESIVPLPPLGEQKRIVARIEELLNVCKMVA